MRILLFILPCVALGILLAVMAAGVKKGTNIFKIPAVAWMITGVMVVVAIGIGIERTEGPPVSEPAPRPGSAAVPDLNYVWDDADALSVQTERELSQRNGRLWNSHSVSIGVVTCDNAEDLGEYAMKCSEVMGLGGYDFIVALDIAGENYWLIQGNDLRRDFTDQDCSDFAYDCMEQSFAKGDYDKAVLKLTQALEDWYDNYFD